jgi:hypothetical protein
LKKITGESIGRVTLRNFRHGPAPSTDAASYSSPGICFSPARKITIGAPNCHTASRIIIGRMSDGMPTQPPMLMPNRLRLESTGPSVVNIARHTIAMLTLAPMRDGA